MEAETKLTYWQWRSEGVQSVTTTNNRHGRLVYGQMADEVYDHCKTQIKGRKDSEPRKIEITIRG